MPSEKPLTLDTLAWKCVFQRLREERGLKQEQFSDLVKITKSGDWERGRRPGPTSLEKVERRLELEPETMTVLHAAEVLKLRGDLLDETGDRGPAEYDKLLEVTRAIRSITFPDENLQERMSSDELVGPVVDEMSASVKGLINQFRRLQSSLAFTKDSKG